MLGRAKTGHSWAILLRLFSYEKKWMTMIIHDTKQIHASLMSLAGHYVKELLEYSAKNLTFQISFFIHSRKCLTVCFVVRWSNWVVDHVFCCCWHTIILENLMKSTSKAFYPWFWLFHECYLQWWFVCPQTVCFCSWNYFWHPLWFFHAKHGNIFLVLGSLGFWKAQEKHCLGWWI